MFVLQRRERNRRRYRQQREGGWRVIRSPLLCRCLSPSVVVVHWQATLCLPNCDSSGREKSLPPKPVIKRVRRKAGERETEGGGWRAKTKKTRTKGELERETSTAIVTICLSEQKEERQRKERERRSIFRSQDAGSERERERDEFRATDGDGNTVVEANGIRQPAKAEADTAVTRTDGERRETKDQGIRLLTRVFSLVGATFHLLLTRRRSSLPSDSRCSQTDGGMREWLREARSSRAGRRVCMWVPARKGSLRAGKLREVQRQKGRVRRRGRKRKPLVHTDWRCTQRERVRG